MTDTKTAWHHAKLALQLLAVDPAGLCGIWLRARAGVPRDRFIAGLAPLFATRQIARIHPFTDDDQLFGGVDLSATLNSGKTVRQTGLLNIKDALLVVSMAERADAALAARLCQSIDRTRHPVIALDEGLADEALHPGLQDRLGFHLDLEGLAHRDTPELVFDSDTITLAQRRLVDVRLDTQTVRDLTHLALRLGITDIRAPLLALRAVRAHAALSGRDVPTEQDVLAAASLVLMPRACTLPDAEQLEAASSEPEDTSESSSHAKDLQPPADLLLEAITAQLPENLLETLKSRSQARTASATSGAGDRRKGNRRGRPKPAKRGRPGSANRLDLVATLRAAAPWQAMRRSASHALDQKVHIRASDIRLKQFEDRSDRLLIFVVDASGSAALARLAEAKGAVELLLAEAYARRDHVALIAFRGEEADLLLPPTRSLVQTKRRLAGLPGGGGTPLATGLEAAMELAHLNRKKGLTPTIALLTDGRANISLTGKASRIEAADDARAMARRIAGQQTPAIVIDTGMRPQSSLQDLARDLDATYVPMPRADAHKVSEAIGAALV